MTADHLVPPSAEDLKEYQELSALQAQMRQMLLARYQENMAALARYLPELAKFFATYKPAEKLDFFCTHNGVPNLYWVERQEVFYKVEDPLLLCEEQVRHYLQEHPFEQVKYRQERDPYGQIHYRYVNECVKITKAYPREDKLTPLSVGSMPNCVMLGLGLGYQLDYLYAQVEIYNLIVVEPNPDLFYASLHAFNWAPLLQFLADNHYGIKLLIGTTAQDLCAELYSFYDRHGRFLSGFCFNYVHYHSAEIEKLKQQLKRDYSRNFQALGFFDDHLFALSHAAYAIRHQARLVRQDREILPEYVDKPVFLIGSGPSLDQDLDFLRRHQDKALIFACGTALECLYHAGIVPDFYCCTERTPEVAQSLEQIHDPTFFDQVILLSTEVVHPRVLRLFKQQALLAKLDEPFYWMELPNHPEVLKWRPAILINPLVGNMGLSGALHLGFRQLYLFGFDNGKKSTFTRLHSKESVHYQQPGAENGGNYQLTQTVEGNFGGEVQTNKLYLLCIHMLEDLLVQFKDTVQCTNCSDGAKLQGMRACHSNELEEVFQSLSPLDKRQFKAWFKTELTFTLPLGEEQLLQDLHKSEFTRIVQNLCQQLKNRPQSRCAYVEFMQQVSEYLTQLSEQQTTKGLAFMLYGTLQSIFLMLLRALYHSSDEAVCLADAHKILDFYDYFLRDALLLYDYLPDYILGEHLSYLQGKLGSDYPQSKAPPVPALRLPISQEAVASPLAFRKRYS